jgi:hypothetical protein
MKQQRLIAMASMLLCAIIFSGGCGKKATQAEPSATPKAAGVIPEYQLKALEKAKSVEALLEKENQQRLKMLDQ